MSQNNATILATAYDVVALMEVTFLFVPKNSRLDLSGWGFFNSAANLLNRLLNGTVVAGSFDFSVNSATFTKVDKCYIRIEDDSVQ
ncbi:MAG: hypothetical protein WBE61_08500 [Nitrososphaeraceae archaeon]